MDIVCFETNHRNELIYILIYIEIENNKMTQNLIHEINAPLAKVLKNVKIKFSSLNFLKFHVTSFLLFLS